MPTASVPVVEVREALSESGALGATVRQLATRLSRPSSSVEHRLADLQSRGEVLRIGRGLWILQSFAELEQRSDFLDPASFVERFSHEGGVALGRYSGPITFRSNDRLPVHRWWPYVQGYSAEFVADLLTRSGLRRGATILDPFAGSGTSLVEARRAGARAIGYELLPPAALAARVKTRFELDPADLELRARQLLARSETARPAPLPFLRETRQQFSRRALSDLRRLKGALPAADGSDAVDALRLAFDASLIPCSRLRRSPCLGYDPNPRGRPRPRDQFLATVTTMAEDLRALAVDRASWGPAAEVLAQDARQITLPAGSVDLAITSPPYVNGLDYVMNYKLDLAWLDYASSYRELTALRQAEVACDNLPREATREFRGTESTLDPWLGEILVQIQENVRRKGSYRRNDMHGVVHRYFRDLADVLAGVYRTLRPGGQFVLVVGDSLLAGTYVPGDLLLARIGQRLGFTIRGVDVARTRRSGQRRGFVLRESIVTLERPRHAV